MRFDKISVARLYEVENAEFSSGISLNPNGYSGYSGSGYAGSFTATGQSVTFTVDAPAAGEYAMVMRYGAGQTDAKSRTFSLYANGAKVGQSRLGPVNDWNLWMDALLSVNLNEGQNTITIRRDSAASGGTDDSGEFTVDYITLKPAQWVYAGDIEKIDGNGTKQLMVTLDNAVVQITSVGKNAVKVWLEPSGRFSRMYESFAVVNDEVDPQNLSAADKGNCYEIDTGAMIMRLQKSPFKITYLDKSGKVICENEEQSMGWTSDGEMIVNSKLPEDEQFWGLGEKFTTFNYRGTKMINWATDVGNETEGTPMTRDEGYWYMANPYYVSSKGYSILFDNPSRSVFDFGKTNPEVTSFGSVNPVARGELLYYFTYGPDLKQISKTASDYMGKTFFAPIWAYGNSQCHWGYRQSDIERVAQAYRDYGIPLDIMFGDIEWYKDYCTPTAWHPTNFPNPEGMIAKLKSLNLKFALIDDPNITAAGNIADYVYADEHKYFAKDMTGNTKQVQWPWGGTSGLMDFFNPEARYWWGEQHNMMLAQGVDAFWVDMNEPARSVRDWYFWNEDGKAYGSLYDVKNAYATVHNKTIFDKLHENGKRSLILTRSGFTGVHRYSSPWTGDISGNYTSASPTSGISGLAEQIRMGTNLSFTGYNYWGFDIGGFTDNLNTKLFKRWIELACFTPMHRFHYANWKPASEAYMYNAADVSKKYISLRYRLKPYMYSLTADNILGIGIENVDYSPEGSGGTGIPYVRAMAMEYMNDPNTWSMDTQFMAGPSFLVAPVVEDADVKQVYLPEGKWYDYFNSPLVFDGDRTITYDAPEDVLPLFVKAGSIIPMYPDMQYWDPKFVDRVTLDVYPTFSDGDFNFALYEDDGETEAYLDGHYTTTQYNCNVSMDEGKTIYTFNIGERTGTYTDIAPRDYLLQFHRGAMKGLSVKLGDTALEAKGSLEALEASATGYFADDFSDICYVKIPDNATAATVVLSGELIDRETLELEDGILSGGAEISDSETGYSGWGYVTGLNSVSDSVSLNLLYEHSGLYPVYIRCRSNESTALNVSLGEYSVTVPLAGKKNGEWEETVALFDLQKGTNQIVISGTGASGSAIVDCIRISEKKFELSQYNKNMTEAEDGRTIGSNARIRSSTVGYTGSGYVENFTATGDGVVFENLSVLKDGRYAVKIRYRNSNAATRTMHIYSNDNEAGAVQISLPRFRLQNTATWNEVVVTLPLKQGDNTITVVRQAGDNGSNVMLDNLYCPMEPIDLNKTSLVVNGGFETRNTDGWTLKNSGTSGYGVDTNDAILESYKFYFWNGSSSTEQWLSQTVNGADDGDYLLNFWAMTYNAKFETCQVQLAGFDGENQVIFDVPYNGAWTQYSIPVTIKDGKIDITYYWKGPASSSLQLDDVTLWKIASKEPFLMNDLGEAIETCETLNRDNYSEESFNEFQIALQLAQRWHADPTTPFEQIKVALDLLNDAAASLVSVGPAIASITTPGIETLVADYAANIPVQVVLDGEIGDGTIIAELFDLGGELWGSSKLNAAGYGLVKIENRLPAGIYKLVVSIKGTGVQGFIAIEVEPAPDNLWSPIFGADGDNLLITFGAPITFKGPVTINNDPKSVEIVGNKSLAIIGVSPDVTGTIVVKGIKYPRLFPSYSFTFTLTK